MDIVSLRIDNQERMANMLNDCEISPTNYMIAFLRQRGWKMPGTTMRIPNVIPEVDPIAEKVCLSVPLPHTDDEHGTCLLPLPAMAGALPSCYMMYTHDASMLVA